MTGSSWRVRLALLSLASSLALAGCTADNRTPAPPVATSAPGAGTPVPDEAAQATADELVRTALARDRPAFLAQVSSRDPSFAARARLLYDNLSRLPLARLGLRLRPIREPVTSGSQAVLGRAAWRQQATVSWRLTGETATAVSTVWLTFVLESDGVRFAGTIDQPAGTPAQTPLWWTGPVRAARKGDVVVLTGSGQRPDPWLDRAGAAATDVRRRLTARAARHWTGAVVVEVPASRSAFEAVVGARPGSYTDIAAVTLAEGPTATAAVRVVVNPDVTRRLSDLGVATVLTHELVHVATRSAESPAPTWAVEGLADDIALAAHPGAASASARLLRHRGAPEALPSDRRFDAGAPELDLAYAQAWSLCRYVDRTWSPAATQRLYTALDRGLSLDRAAHQQLGVSAAALTAGWRRWLGRGAAGLS